MKTTIKVSKRIFRVEFSEIGHLYTATVCGLVLSSHSLEGLRGKIKRAVKSDVDNKANIAGIIERYNNNPLSKEIIVLP